MLTKYVLYSLRSGIQGGILSSTWPSKLVFDHYLLTT